VITVEFQDDARTVASIRQPYPWRWWERLFRRERHLEIAVVAVAALYGGVLWIYDDSNKPVTDQRIIDALDLARAARRARNGGAPHAAAVERGR